MESVLIHLIENKSITVQCRYNAVNLLTNIHKRHPIARPLGGHIGNTFIYTYQYIDMKVKWLAAVNSLY